MSSERVVLAGAGLASHSTATHLRQYGFTGPITLIGEEPLPPYDRPPLSKQALWDSAPAQPRPLGELASLEVDFRPRVRVTSLDPGRRVLGTDNGDVAYDSLVIATGATPRRLEPSGIDGVLTLRSFADAVALRAALGRQPQLVTVGAGLIGCEVAGAAALAGLSVTVVDPMATPMDRSLGPVAGGRVARMLEDVGVRLEMGTGVDAIVGWDRVTGVRLSDGRTLNADLVLLALGAIPAVGWLAGSGVEVRRGVVTDESGRTNIPGVYAAGDVAESYRRLAGAHAVLEHWMNAREQGAAVAAAILGRPPTRGLLPYFWSDQLGKKIQGLGEVGGPGPVHVVEWEAPKPGAIYLYGSAEHLSGAVGFDAARRLMRLRPLIERGATWADAQVLTVSA